jgi:DNA-binding XRE family transcriptional regulator|tara:strand:- start:10691 stop:10975 length:285 start_codon:yes stop_codon:yes gene_type:complete
MTKIPLDFGKVESLREHMLLTVSHMAQLMGVSRMTYYGWVRGKPIRANNEAKAKNTLRQLIALVKDGQWPVEGAKSMTAVVRYQTLLEVLEGRE